MSTRRLIGDEALAVSPTARRMLTALGYNISQLAPLHAHATDSLPAALRAFEDPRTQATVEILDSHSHEAPGVTIRIRVTRRDDEEHEPDGALYAFTFHYDRLRGSLFSRLERSPNYSIPPQAIATNFITQRTFQGEDALHLAGILFQSATPAGPELLRMHEAIGRLFSQPQVTPAPGKAPSTLRP